MPYSLSFSRSHRYDTRQIGVFVPVTIHSGSEATNLYARVDTGSSFCVFERQHGEKLGLDVEKGTPQQISTVAGSFLTYAHEVT